MSIPQATFVLKGLVQGRDRFLYGLDRTPGERLHWSPDGAKKSPLQVAGSLAQFLRFIAATLARQEVTGWDVDTLPIPPSREAARESLQAAFADLYRAVKALEPADLTRRPPAPWSEESLEEVLWLINATIFYHQGQLNYIQLCYGDRDPNIPPDPASPPHQGPPH